MTTAQAIVLGIVQGLGEFLPISSSGHLIVVPWLLGWPDHGLAFDVALHLGTLAAVLFAFAADWVRLVSSAVRCALRGKPFEPPPERDYSEGIPVVIASVRRNHPRALDPAIKSNNLLNNILAVREGQARGAAETILLNDLGEVAEGASSNVFVVKDGRAATPPLTAGILSGITRRVVLDLCRELGVPAREETLRVADLFAADEVFITSTTKEAAPVRTIDGKPVASGRPGPVHRRILQAYREYALRSVSR